MDLQNDNMMQENSIFLWIAAAIGFILLIPLIAMQFSNEVNWGFFDFVIMGTLLFTVSSSFVLIARRVNKKMHQVALGIGFLILFLWVWAELAVGIFTNWGS